MLLWLGIRLSMRMQMLLSQAQFHAIKLDLLFQNAIVYFQKPLHIFSIALYAIIPDR